MAHYTLVAGYSSLAELSVWAVMQVILAIRSCYSTNTMNFVFSLISVLKTECRVYEKVIMSFIMKCVLGHNSDTS